jgi:hypothetical protein
VTVYRCFTSQQGNIIFVKIREITKRKANWIGHILRRNRPLQRVIEGNIKGGIEVAGRRGRRRRTLLDDPKERRGNCHLNEEALRSRYVESSLWKRLWTCPKTDLIALCGEIAVEEALGLS